MTKGEVCAREAESGRLVALCGLLERQKDFLRIRREALGFLARFPDDAAVLALLGRAELRLRRPGCAVAPLRRCFRLTGSFVFRLLLSHALHESGAAAEARAELEATERLMPFSGLAFFMAGAAFDGIGDIPRALRFYEQSLKLSPDVACVNHRVGRIMLDYGDAERALELTGRALAAEPGVALYYLDYGVALELAGRFDAAYGAVEAALELDPGNVEARHNLAHLCLLLNRPEEALALTEQVLEMVPDYPPTRFTRGIALLKCGRWDEGWRDYEWRWRHCQVPRADLCAAPWQGEDLRGRTILLHAEQGLGDSLQFIRFARDVGALGASRVVVEAPPALCRLFRRMEGISEVVSSLPAGAVFDYHCPLASLPLWLGVRPDTLRFRRYFSVPPAEARREGALIRAGAGPEDLVVGLVWSGDPRPHRTRASALDRRRSVRLEQFAPLFSVPGVRFESFQMGAPAAEREESGFPLADGTRGIADFADTAARLTGVDLLISVDTSIVHLAGGMGVPVWMLSRSDGCWRWLQDRADTPWYPSVRIFRQEVPGEWGPVMADLTEGLMARVARRPGCVQKEVV